MENACHELDIKGLLQGAGGGWAYEEYVRSFRRDVELADKSNTIKAQMVFLQQLVTIYTISTSLTGNPTQVAQLDQLQSAVTDKERELQLMVIHMPSVTYN